MEADSDIKSEVDAAKSIANKVKKGKEKAKSKADKHEKKKDNFANRYNMDDYDDDEDEGCM